MKPRGADKNSGRAGPRYARVYFDVKTRFGLSASEYLVADVVFVLSRKKGWCFASREYLCRVLGLSRESLEGAISRLLRLELLEVQSSRTMWLRPSEKWTEAVRMASGGER